ncbi:unnamed protein product [Sympodiomycopsis kandeliae]
MATSTMAGRRAAVALPIRPTRLVTPHSCLIQSQVRCISSSSSRRNDNKSNSSSSSNKNDNSNTGSSDNGSGGFTRFLNSTAAEAALGASAGVILLGAAGLGYHSWYKERVLTKMERAFDAGFDPVLALAESGGANLGQLAYVRLPDREEDALVRRILKGEERGRYFLILGPKGSGKTTSLIQAMADQRADGVAFFEGHSDPSIVVDRFSEAINYSMYRDYLGNLVGLSDLQGMSPFQNLERALHKLEGALIRRRQKTGRPAIIIMNNSHLLGQEDEGTKLLAVLQQRAEKWASAGTATFVFTSHDYYIYNLLRRNSNRMDTLTFKDLSRRQSMQVLKSCRYQYWGEDVSSQNEDVLDAVYRITGGRLSLLNKVSRRRNMLKAAHQLIEDDMQFVLSKTGIIEDHDDDVMDEQKWSTCSWLLFVALAKKQQELEEEQQINSPHLFNSTPLSSSTTTGDDDVAPTPSGVHSQSFATHGSTRESSITDPSNDLEPDIGHIGDVPNPSITWGEARQIMTRPDFITELDHLNLIHIDKHHHIRSDSMPLLRSFRKVLENDKTVDGTGSFEEKLEMVMDRVSAIESLNRTRELVWKEQGQGGKVLIKSDHKGREIESWSLLGGDERLGRDTGDEDGD